MRASWFLGCRVYGLAVLLALVTFGAHRQTPKVKPIDQQLLKAAERGDLAAAQKALSAGANPNAAHWDSNTLTALMLAARSGNSELVKLLVDKNATVNQTAMLLADALGHSQAGITALMQAAESGDLPTLRVLLARKADVNARDSDGSPVLMYSPNVQVMQILLEAQANPNVVDKDGYTILMRATEMGDRDAVQLLLAHGAEPSLTGTAGKTALSLAENKGEEDIVRQSKAAGALK